MKASDIKRGNVVQHNQQLYAVKEIEKSSPTGRGGNTTYRFIMYAIPGGHKLDVSFRADDDLQEVELERREVSFSYREGDRFTFMDSENYTQYLIDAEVIGDDAGYICDGLEGCYVMLKDDMPISFQLPLSVVLTVVDTPPELKGASATKRTKPAKLDTGLEIQVPEYIVNGEKIRVNTETGEFSGRA